jgi:hypothetical protein
MKIIIASLSCLLATTVLPPPAQSASSATIAANSTLRAMQNCDAAVMKKAGPMNFTQTPLMLSNGSTVDVYVANSTRAEQSKTTTIVVWIKDVPVHGEETPTITAVCVGNQLNAPSAPKGRIDFHSSPGDKIYIRFHLEALTRSKWKKDTSTGAVLANDSVMMQEYAESETPPNPDLTKWASCAKPKHVDITNGPLHNDKDTDISFNFSRCANPGAVAGPHSEKNLFYEYKLVLDKYPVKGGDPTDYPIDPIIINRPY